MTELDRRKLLRRTGAAISVTGLSTVGTVGSAGADYGPSMIKTRDHFDEDCNLSSHENATSFDTDDTVPCIDTSCVNDLTVMVHGWKKSHSEAIDKTDDCAHALYDNENYEYPGEVIGFSWDSDKATSWYDWGDATCIAQENGPKLANALEEIEDGGVDYLRVVTHSLGVQVLFSALRWLHDSNTWSSKLRTAHLTGAAVDNEAPTDESDWTQENYHAIRYETDSLFNYYSENDMVLHDYYPDHPALGEKGADSGHNVPCNYNDYDATYDVDGHSDYLASLGAEMMDHIKYSDYYDCS
jgi:hypothetical protein